MPNSSRSTSGPSSPAPAHLVVVDAERRGDQDRHDRPDRPEHDADAAPRVGGRHVEMHDAGQEVAREHGGEQAQRDEVRGKIDGLQLPFAAGEEGPGVGCQRQAQRPAADRHRRHRDQEAAGVARQHPVDQRPPLALERDRRQLVLPARDLGVQVIRPALAVLEEPLPERQIAHRRGDQRQQQQQCHKRRGGPQPLRVGNALDMLDEAREWVTPVHLRPSLRGACRRQAHLLDGRCPFECPPAGAPKLAWNCANRKAPFLIWVDAARAPYRSGGALSRLADVGPQARRGRTP